MKRFDKQRRTNSVLTFSVLLWKLRVLVSAVCDVIESRFSLCNMVLIFDPRSTQ